MVTDNHRSVHREGVARGEGCFAADRHLFDLAVLCEPSEDQVVNLFCGDIGEPCSLELRHHVLVVAAAYLRRLDWGVDFLVGAIASCKGCGQDACRHQSNNFSHGSPRGATPAGSRRQFCYRSTNSAISSYGFLGPTSREIMMPLLFREEQL